MSSHFPSIPVQLTDYVDYQQGSIVSKEILRTQSGTVSLFAFAQGQGLSEHSASFDVLAYISEGTAEITISGQTQKVSSGEMIRMPANEPHSVFARENFKMMLIMLRR